MQLKRRPTFGKVWLALKKTQSTGSNPIHQTVASSIKFKCVGQSIQIEFTDQQLSPHAGRDQELDAR
jgi:hypothetical protein